MGNGAGWPAGKIRITLNLDKRRASAIGIMPFLSWWERQFSGMHAAPTKKKGCIDGWVGGWGQECVDAWMHGCPLFNIETTGPKRAPFEGQPRQFSVVVHQPPWGSQITPAAGAGALA